MKKLQKLLFGVAFTLLAATVGAQMSNTNIATSGTFTTDVDNFMNVNNWNTVNPKILFAYSSFSKNNIDLGFAKQINNKKNSFYLGAYYNGTLWSNMKSSSDKTGDNKSSEDKSANSFGALFGFGTWGIKLSTSFNNNKTVTVVNPVTKTIDNSYFYIGLSAGTTLKTKKMDLTPYASISFNNKSDKTVTESKSPTETTDNSYGLLSFTLGTGIPLKSNKTIKQSLDIPLTLGFNTYPKYSSEGDKYSTSTKYSGFNLEFSPSYMIKTKPADNISVNAVARLPINFDTDHIGNTDTVTDGTTKTTEADQTSSSFSFYTILGAGLQYTVKPEKFIINFGLYASLPKFTLTVDEDTKSDPVTKDTNTYTDTFSTSVTSGFTYFFTKNICADTYMSIFNTTSSGVTTSLDYIWNAKMAFAVSVKY